MGLRWLCFFLLAVSSSVSAQPLNCDTLIHSNIPFELTLKTEKGELFKSQIYRSDNLYKTIFTKRNDKVGKSVVQANFVKSTPGILGKEMKFTYNVPTDRYWFDQGISSVHVKADLATSAIEKDEHLTLSNDEDISLGPCIFHTKHYSTDGSSKDRAFHSEIWMALGLNAIIKSQFRSTNISTQTVSETSNEAIDISSDFVPMH